jgi:hypothetical protein
VPGVETAGVYVFNGLLVICTNLALPPLLSLYFRTRYPVAEVFKTCCFYSRSFLFSSLYDREAQMKLGINFEHLMSWQIHTIALHITPSRQPPPPIPPF